MVSVFGVGGKRKRLKFRPQTPQVCIVAVLRRFWLSGGRPTQFGNYVGFGLLGKRFAGIEGSRCPGNVQIKHAIRFQIM